MNDKKEPTKIELPGWVYYGAFGLIAFLLLQLILAVAWNSFVSPVFHLAVLDFTKAGGLTLLVTLAAGAVYGLRETKP